MTKAIPAPTEATYRLTHRICKQLAAHGYIASLWHIEDVQSVRPDLSASQSMEVLQQCLEHHDAECGINWETIRVNAGMLYPEPETTETEE